MITPGGEEAFVSKMVHESITLGERCRHVSSFGVNSPPVLEQFSQMVHLYAWKTVISRGPRDAPTS